VANHCSPETLQVHREKWGREAKQREDDQARQGWEAAEAQAFWQRILDDPKESAEEKALAGRMLGLAAQGGVPGCEVHGGREEGDNA
jgi:hypothetical protein